MSYVEALKFSNLAKISENTRHYHDHAMQQQRLYLNEPMICKHFGCGQRLTPQEQLYGNKCIIHSMGIKPIEPTDFAILPE